MKTLKKILIGLLILIVVLLGIAFLLPSRMVVKQTHTVKASPMEVYNLVVHLPSWQHWSPWASEEYLTNASAAVQFLADNRCPGPEPPRSR